MPDDEIVAIAVAAVAEELKTDVSRIRVVSFEKVEKSDLERYIEEHSIRYTKYQLGDQHYE